MLFIFLEKDLFAQKIKIKRSHAITEADFSFSHRPATGTLNIIAIMVEFQPDTNGLTSGTGVFEGGLPYLERNPDISIEPLPHNREYFEAHLEFAKNYYEKSSDGQLTIDYQVLPGIYRLPKKMKEYSPVGETFTNEKLSDLTRDAWQLVEANGGFDATGLDPDRTAFVIFHAGVGRDIELIGTNLDITPYDIPSLYLSKNNLKNLLDNPAFQGFEINNGTFRITNSLIIPRTESRRGLDIQENEFVFPLSINGLLVASIGSHLGLPDLFNTETGDPAIGRFGLMDGAGFFAYNGLLPPEPSAWEKIYLGWEDPFIIQTNEANAISLPAGSLNEPNSIATYELSSSEYFLVENRHRDPDSTGVTLTFWQFDGNGTKQVQQQTFTNADDGFVNQTADLDTLLKAGVLVNADNFDFSLPGGLDIGEDDKEGTEDDRNLNGGILIWHIDEAMIQSGLQTGGVNTDRFRRGVDLEEADGPQDIGPGIPGAIDNSASFGSPFDYWWSGNNYRVINEFGSATQLYENRFGPDTQPDNKSNSGAPSFFEFYDFSENLPVASFRIRAKQPYQELYELEFSTQLDSSRNYFTPADFYYNYYPLSLSIYETQTDTFLVVPSVDGATAVNISNPESQQFHLTNTSIQQPFVGDELVLAEKPLQNSPTIEVSSLNWNAGTSAFDTLWTATIPKNKGFISSQNGDTLHADFTTAGLLASDGTVITLQATPFQESEKINGNKAIANQQSVVFEPNIATEYLPDDITSRFYTGIIQVENRSLFYVMENDKLALIDPKKDSPITLLEETVAEWPAILDDASVLWVDSYKNEIVGINRIGGIMEFTPISAPDNVQFIGTPLYTDLINSGTDYATLVVGQDNLSLNIFAYDAQGKAIDGFPLYVGNAIAKKIQPIHPIIYNNTLYALSHDGVLKAWNLTQVSDTKWSGRYGDFNFNKLSAVVQDKQNEQSLNFEILNADETYNWPNPARDMTNIRFEIAPPGGNVEIKVITMSGRVIFEDKVYSSGGFPQEVQVNTQNWASGGYVAMVKATVEGKTETKLIKIGVLH